ncbi:MFS transporter [Ruegeria sp. SCP11]|uniref:MFS transporter n=1 Tax=Ruegeria sp. SCP11 TaxID=3141378 RepID=UPI00333849A3
MDETAVGVALPSIRRELGLSEISSHWVVNIYLLTLACLAGAAGRIGDIVGIRVLLTAGLTIFGAASIFAGFAPNGLTLLLARGVQGIGAAAIFPLSLTLIALSFEEKGRGKALGIYGAIGTCFLAAGPLVGGVLTAGLSWRWIFWINPIVVICVGYVVWRLWRDPPRRIKERFDLIGLVLLLCGLSLSVYGIMQGPEVGWQRGYVIATLVFGISALVVFVLVEKQRDDPLVAVALFRNSTFTASNLIVGTAQYAKIATFVFGSMYLQTVEGWGPLWAGIALLPAVLPTTLAAPVAGKLSDERGTRWPALLGLLLITSGLSLTAAGMMFQITAAIFIGFASFGTAVSLMFVPSQRAVTTSVAPHMQGQAGGIVLSSQLIGGTLGMAVCSTILAVTSSFAAVFWVAGIFSMLVLAYSNHALDTHEPAR